MGSFIQVKTESGEVLDETQYELCKGEELGVRTQIIYIPTSYLIYASMPINS